MMMIALVTEHIRTDVNAAWVEEMSFRTDKSQFVSPHPTPLHTEFLNLYQVWTYGSVRSGIMLKSDTSLE
jgi:hypothetical protein